MAIIAVMIYTLGSFIPAISTLLIDKVNMLHGQKDNDITSILVLVCMIANVAAIMIHNGLSMELKQSST